MAYEKRGLSLFFGAIAQLGERLLCKQEVTGSIPVGSTRLSRNKAWNLAPSGTAFRFAVSFIRLLFNNLEEVKRIRTLRPDSSG